MRFLITALLLSVSASTSIAAWADNIASCEVVLMEKIAQEGLEGSAEVASFRPAEDFIASIYDEKTDVLREIDGLPIRAIMCKRQSVIPSLRDFPIIATGTPFMISQNFDSAETGLTTVYFQDGKFRSSYKGPELDAKMDAKLTDRMDVFNLQPHDLAEKEKAMLNRKTAQADEDTDEDIADENIADEDIADEDIADEDIADDKKEQAQLASEDELIGLSKETSKLDNVASEDELLGATKTSSKEEADAAVDEEKPILNKKMMSAGENAEAAQVASEDELLGLSKEISKTDNVASEDELIGVSKASSTEESEMVDDSKAESAEEKEAAPKQKAITKKQHDTYK